MPFFLSAPSLLSPTAASPAACSGAGCLIQQAAVCLSSLQRTQTWSGRQVEYLREERREDPGLL